MAETQTRLSSRLSSWMDFLRTQNFFAILILIFIVIAIRLPIDYHRIMTPTDNDFGTHIYFALDMLHGRPVPAYTLAHSLWQYALIFVWWLSRSRIDFWQTAIGIQVVSSVVTALIVYFWYGQLPGRPSAWLRVFWAASLVLVAPVMLPFLFDHQYYFGYIGLANYHNPTVHVLRPLALLMFIAAFSALTRPRISLTWVILTALITAAATFLKPNYSLVLLPALGLGVLYQMARRTAVDWRMIIAGLGLPAVSVLLIQYWITYAQGDTGVSIAWMPLAAASHMASGLLPKFFLSIIFPLVMSILSFQPLKRSPLVGFAWLGFGIGAAQFYLLAETGERLGHSNFLWGAQIALFILFASLGRWIVSQHEKWSRTAAWGSYLPYFLHIIAGVLYYLYCFQSSHYS